MSRNAELVAAYTRARAIAAAAAAPPFPAAPKFTGDLRPVVLEFQAHEKARSYNATRGKSWRSMAEPHSRWLSLGVEVGHTHRELLAPFRGHRVHITFGVPVTNQDRCDAGNFAGCEAVKAMQDGLVISGALVPDDTIDWVVTSVDFWNGGTTGLTVRLRVSEAGKRKPPGTWVVSNVPQTSC